MTVSTNTNFAAYNALTNKWPLYVIEFDGESVKYCNHIPANPTGTYKRYLKKISGLTQTVKPEKGQATIGGITISLLDKDSEITALLATDSVNFHRKKVVIKAGYKGMDQSDLITIATFWVTGLKKSSDNLSWEFMATDPQKNLQKTICRTATDSVPVVYRGNLVNILLSILTSSGSGTNSDYDLGDDDYGCGLDSDTVDITAIEAIRDDWFWGSTYTGVLSIYESEEAKDIIEKEILQILNCYPAITGEGKYKIIPFKPPIETTENSVVLDEDNIVGIPRLDLNFKGIINQIDYYYDHDGDDYLTNQYFIDATSYGARGNASRPLEIKSRALHESLSPSSVDTNVLELITNRSKSVFTRYSDPPIKLPVETLFSQWIAEAGDIISFTHSKVDDVENGTVGLSAERMEIVNRSVDWIKGTVKHNIMMTGFQKGTYSACSPHMTITSGSSGTSFNVSVSDAALWTAGWEAKILNSVMKEIATVTILTINTGTGAITCDDIGQTPSAGWYVVFADYDNCTTGQQLYGFIADLSNYLGAANDAAHLVVP